MKVNVMQPCSGCKGLKKQVHPLWWMLFNRREQEPDLTAAEFFLEHGLVTAAERPSVIVPCQRCYGTGEVATWVPLKCFLELVHYARQGLYKVLGGIPI